MFRFESDVARVLAILIIAVTAISIAALVSVFGMH